MAKKKDKFSYNEIPDKNEDWSLDTRNGKQYSGESVQGFIKKMFEDKAGVFHYDEPAAMYLIFADEENRDLYLSNPVEYAHLLIGSFNAPANYNMSISLITEAYNAIGRNDKGNIIRFTFKTVDKADAEVIEPVNITYTIIRGSTTQTINATAQPKAVVEFNVDDYLDEGTNYITISVQGRDTKASTSRTVTYRVVNLSLTDEFDIAAVREIDENAINTIDVPFRIQGSGTKYMEWFIDGEQVPTISSEDTIIYNDVTQTKTVNIDTLAQGVHTLQFRAYVLDSASGERFYSSILYREFIVLRGDAPTAPMIAVKADLPSGSDILTPSEGEALTLSGFTQYVEASVDFATYNPTGSALEVTVNITGGNQNISSVLNVDNETLTSYTFVPTSSGVYEIDITGGGITKSFVTDIALSQINVTEITQNLLLNLQPTGKTNSSADREEWNDGDIVGTLENFYFNVNDGWKQVAYDEDGESISAQRLVISEGRRVTVGFNPLEHNVNIFGMTLELLFSVNKDADPDAVVLDMMNNNGVGFKVTASEVMVRTASGTEVSTKFKPGDNMRVGIVINPQSGVSENYRNLILLFVDGEIAGGVKYANGDSFGGKSTMVFEGTGGAVINLGQIRCYRTALSWEQEINNWLLYQDTTEQMLLKYSQNDIYDNDGNVSVDKLLNRAPVWMQTGPYKTIDGTTDKSTNIRVDVDFRNNQDPTRAFTAKNLYERGQGTSSMIYPVKNLRPNFQKAGNTKLYDHEGNLDADNLYAHKQGARPVDEYTLKTDYAESSGTHNAGVARLWNDCLYNAKVKVSDVAAAAILEGDGVAVEQGESYRLRTDAQVYAEEQGYEYDVRTTVDGYPMTLFVRESSSDQWHFHGKYNFLNDKSNVPVFGFEIPDLEGFAERFPLMQCWEVLDSSNNIALFKPGQNFDEGWGKAFEGRHPDGSNQTAQMKALYNWLSTVSQEDFKAQKWEHFDVFNVAAYYVYLMRYGAVDQTVKNAMMTTEDGVHWKYYNYDNDTVLGLKNNGMLVYGPYITRSTEDHTEAGAWAYAGHESVLWNLFEADDVFMNVIVPMVDAALYEANGEYSGNGWASVIDVFEHKQMDAWNERVYNLDAEEKYISNPQYLSSMQGSRKAHRRWWTSIRWAWFDSIWQTGNYKSNIIVGRFVSGSAVGDKAISIKAGMRGCYGYGINNVTYEHTEEKMAGDSAEFTIDGSASFNIGNPIALYAAYGIEAFDISEMMPYLSTLDIKGAVSERLGTQLKKIVLGASTTEEAESLVNTTFNGLDVTSAYRLEELNIRGLLGQTSLDLTKNTKLKKLLAYNSGLTLVNFAPGAPLVKVELPDTIESFSIEDSVDLLWDDVTFGGQPLENSSVGTINIKGCPQLAGDFTPIYSWFEANGSSASDLSLTMDNVSWDNVAPADIIAFGAMGHLKLKGVVTLNAITSEQVVALKTVYGENCFNKDYDFYFIAPDSVFINGEDTCVEGDSIQFSMDVVTDKEYIFEWVIVEGGTANQSIDQEGLFTTLEGAGERTVRVQITVNLYREGKIITDTKEVLVQEAVRPTSGTIEGSNNVSKDTEYTLELSPEGINREYSVEWSLSGAAVTNNYLGIKESDKDSAIVELLSADASGEATIKATVTCDDGSSFNVTKNIKAGTTITVNMTSNQSGDTSVDNATATITYGSITKTAQNGVPIDIPINTAIKVTFNAVTNYQTPAETTIVVLTDPAVVNGVYNTEVVTVTLSSWDGTDVSGQSIIIDGETFAGTTASKKIAWGKTYEVSATYRDGYTTPQESVLANQDTRDLAIQYSPLAGTWIQINQNLTDPASMITGDINGEHIQAIRNGSHRYLGKYTADNQMTVCQLDDSDSTKYSDGTTAVLTGNEGDVFMKMPTFYYKAMESTTDVWQIGFFCGEEKPAGEWNKWDGNTLIGVYEAYNTDNMTYSRSEVTSKGSVSQADFKTYSRKRGDGYRIVDWQMHCVMAILFYAQYGHTNCQEKIGTGYTSTCGATNTFGMRDTKGSAPVAGLNDGGPIGTSDTKNFWGLENWWGDKYEWIDNVVVDNYNWKITEPDGTVREPGKAYTSGNWITKLMFGKGCDMIPSAASGGSATTGFCDYYYGSSSSSRVVLRSYSGSDAFGGVACVYASYDSSFTYSSFGSRLAFRGTTLIENNPVTYKALPTFSQSCLKINVSVEQATLTDPVEIRVNGTTYTYTPGQSLYVYLNNGDTYTVEGVSEIEGYIKPTASGTANGFMEINLMYDHPEYGVFILDTDGNLTTRSEWSTSNNSKAVGVAVKTSAHNFVVAPEQKSSAMWENPEILVDGIVTTTDSTTARADYDGEGNTTKIIEQYGADRALAAAACRAYTSKVGAVGYLPALGELMEAYNNVTAINELLTLVGGTTFPTENYHWSSTQFSLVYAWILPFNNGRIYYNNKINNYYVRAFSAFNPSASSTPSTLSNGVYILDASGNLYTKDEWNTANNANASDIVLKTDKVCVAIALTNIGGKAWGTRVFTTLTDVPLISNFADMKRELGGAAFTAAIVSQIPAGNAPAAEYCDSYAFKDGRKGYLPASGELQLAYENMVEINECLKLIGGTAIPTQQHWSSTQYSVTQAWLLSFYGGNLTYLSKNQYYYVRAFSAL